MKKSIVEKVLSVNTLVLLSSLTLFALCANLGFRKVIIISGIVSAIFLIFMVYGSKEKKICLTLLPPLTFIVFVLFSPGSFFVDARIAGRLGCAFVLGVAFSFFCEKDKEKILVSSVFGLLAGAVCALFAYYWMARSIFVPVDRLILQFGHPHHLAFASAFCLILSVCYFEELHGVWKWGLVVTIVLEIIFVFYSVSRSTYIGLALVGLAFMLRYRRIQFLKTLPIFILCVLFLYPSLPVSGQERIHNMLTFEATKDSTIRMRLGFWKSAIQGIREAPIVGKGLRTFTDYDIAYRTKNYEKLKADSSIFIEKNKRWAHPHSLLLGVLYGWGILGLLLFVWSFYTGLQKSTGRDNKFLYLMLVFNIGYGFAELRIKGYDGAFYLFFPLGMAYGGYLLRLTKREGTITQ